MIAREGEFEFDFTTAKIVEKLDDPTKQRPEGMKLVDFVIEEERRLVMIEIKDPSCKAKGGNPAAEATMEKSRADFSKKVQNDTLIAQELTPKARDSYSYLHLMKRDGKPVLYAFLLGADRLSLDPALLLGFKDRLLARLRQEADEPWTRHYVTDCVVLTEQTWALAFPQYPLARWQ
jgi:hypothetical protein